MPYQSPTAVFGVLALLGLTGCQTSEQPYPHYPAHQQVPQQQYMTAPQQQHMSAPQGVQGHPQSEGSLSPAGTTPQAMPQAAPGQHSPGGLPQ